MSKQLNFLDYKPEEIPVVDPNAHPEDKPRLSKSSAAVLERLQAGPATNVELMKVGGMRFGARIHDIKQYGYHITSQRLQNGIWLYELEESK